jgi:hypothetical protein
MTERQNAENGKCEVTLLQVRSVLADKSLDGFTWEVRDLIQKYGAEKLSEVNPKDYASLMAEAQMIGKKASETS